MNHAYKMFVSKGQPEDKFEGIKKMISDGVKKIEDAKKTSSVSWGKPQLTLGISQKILVMNQYPSE